MKADLFIKYLEDLGADFFTGVPDSLLNSFCDSVYDRYNVSDKHIVAANEGAAVALAAGHYLATGRPAAVYMQNSGIGNAVNPICSLINRKVYSIPIVFVIGWRGEPGVHDEPQHLFQGEATIPLLNCLEIPYFVLDRDTQEDELTDAVHLFKSLIQAERSVAFVLKKNALEKLPARSDRYQHPAQMSREQAVSAIMDASSENDIFVCTTGKLSREVFEYRTSHNQPHHKDFLTVGSMGHSCMIALGIAMENKKNRVFCLDGDGAMLMHMGSAVVAARYAPPSFVHVVINNGAHESVGGMPVAFGSSSLCEIARACGYKRTYRAQNKEELLRALSDVQGTDNGTAFIEVICNLDVREDLGRPDIPPRTNKNQFMEHLK